VRKALTASVLVLGALLAMTLWNTDRAAAVGVLSVDQDQYTPGQTVTFTGTGWELCEFEIAVNLIGPEGFELIGPFTQQGGSFSGSFPASTTLGLYLLDADGAQRRLC
jgi:hypothetical protein